MIALVAIIIEYIKIIKVVNAKKVIGINIIKHFVKVYIKKIN